LPVVSSNDGTNGMEAEDVQNHVVVGVSIVLERREEGTVHHVGRGSASSISARTCCVHGCVPKIKVRSVVARHGTKSFGKPRKFTRCRAPEILSPTMPRIILQKCHRAADEFIKKFLTYLLTYFLICL
jgi:hypothetical protein